MGALRSAIDEYVTVDVGSLTESELAQDTVELVAAMGRIQAVLAQRARQYGARGAYRGNGFVSATAWLAQVGDMDRSAASRILAMGDLINGSQIGELVRSGDLSPTRARVLAKVRRHHQEAFERDEELLVEYATQFSLRDFRRLAKHWENCADATRAEESSAQQRDREYLHASTTFGGMVRVDGLLSPETAEPVLEAFDVAMTEAARDGEDQRPASNRRAEAFGEICRKWLDRNDSTVGGRQPHINVVVDWETLLDGIGRRCETEHGGTITAEAARRLACDAGVSRIITNGPSQVLDVGRETRTISPAQRRALVVRDQHCRFAGCERPPSWCDAHHILHWVLGGNTDLINLILLCRRHHGIVHQQPTNLRDGTISLC